MRNREQMLKGKVTVITGAAGGIGQAMARLFGRHGAILVLTDIRKHDLEIFQDSCEDGCFCPDGNDFPANILRSVSRS